MHLRVVHAQAVLHQLIGLANELHIAVFDAVVHHLHKVSGAAFSHPVAAGFAVHMRADGLKDVLHQRPGLRRAARHHARALERAFLAAGNAGADVEKPLALHIGAAAGSIRKVGIAAVDDDVARLQMRQKQLDKVIHGLAGLDHQHHLARLLQRRAQLLNALAAKDVPAPGAPFDKARHLLHRAVVHCHGKALGLHVHHQIFAHHGQTDEADIRLFHLLSFLSLSA